MKLSTLVLLSVGAYLLWSYQRPAPVPYQWLPGTQEPPPPGYYWGSDLIGQPILLPIGSVS